MHDPVVRIDRQPDRKGCALAGCALDQQFTAMLFDDVVTDRQSRPGASSGLLGVKKTAQISSQDVPLKCRSRCP